MSACVFTCPSWQTQRHEASRDARQKKAANLHILEAGIRESLVKILENGGKRVVLALYLDIFIIRFGGYFGYFGGQYCTFYTTKLRLSTTMTCIFTYKYIYIYLAACNVYFDASTCVLLQSQVKRAGFSGISSHPQVLSMDSVLNLSILGYLINFSGDYKPMKTSYIQNPKHPKSYILDI